MKYRAEIDGLRALAVVPVIFFHAGFELFSGGFIGVDVFFVISGYLITTILIEDLESNRFSLINFYERRARRILPALFFVMLVCIPFAWMWMMPNQMKEFSRSLIAVSLFASNILFTRESGYFATASEEKPLLHTWSLAVEEQYYVLFPIFLYLVWRFGKNKVIWLIVVFSAISLAWSEWGWRNSSTGNFYLAHTRAWELFFGSIAAFIVQQRGVKTNNFLAFSGLALIAFALFAYDEKIPFPSVYTLVPVVGTVLLVLYASEETLIAKLLSTRIFVGLGLISYSAYLWHQPLFAFARIRSLDYLGENQILGLTIASFFLAYGSWKYVERPFRKSTAISRKTIFISTISGLIAFITIGLLGHFGAPGLNSEVEIERFVGWKDSSSCIVRDGFTDEDGAENIIKKCFGERKNYFLLGDSHADSISAELRKKLNDEGGNLITLIANGCLPIPGTSRRPLQEKCIQDKGIYWDLIRSTNASVILSARWRLNLVGPRFNNQEGGIEYGKNGQNFVLNKEQDIFTHISRYLETAANLNHLVVLSQIPEAGWNVPERLSKKMPLISDDTEFEISTSYDVYFEQNREIIDMFNKLSEHSNITLIRTENIVCETETGGRCLNTLKRLSLYRDDDHPSPLYSSLISSEIVKQIRK